MTLRLISGLRRFVPARAKHLVKTSRIYIKHKSACVNIYHCCIHKTASQWIRAILSDSRTYRYSGLVPYTYQDTLPGRGDPRKILDRTFAESFPRNTIVTPLYITFENFATIPKPEHYRAFFVMRDPRDIVVSWYFSMRYSHAPMGKIPEHREELNRRSITDGILYTIEHLHNVGLFAALQSWIEAPRRDENIMLVRFEDMTAPDNLNGFKELFSHLDTRVPEIMLYQLLQDYSFERLAGRKRGEEDKLAHYRKGIHGDWRNYFDDTIIAEFKDCTSDLVIRLGYEEDVNWGGIILPE